ncbi:MAG: glycosyltransferase family 2 protein [Gemmatimonadetes bacterium]|nr:glycosyltransferase family 2 protein [Gemmatimonadota bacterium]
MTGSHATPLVSIVIPCYDERENVGPLLERLGATLDSVPARAEILFVDDGSTDGTPELLASMRASETRIKILSLSRNFGHQAALTAGLEAAAGDAVVLMDADLQDPPELIPAFLERWREGYEIVYAVRQKREGGWLKRAAYRLFYRTLRLLADIDIPLDAGDFCLLDRRVVDSIAEMPERNRFLRGLRAWVGFRHVGVGHDRPGRERGTPKYSFRKLGRLALSGYLGFSTVPLRIASVLGLMATGLGLGLAVWTVAARLGGNSTPPGWASAMASDLFLGGVQLLMLGIISEYLGRIYQEVRRRPVYILRDRIGFDDAAAAPAAGVALSAGR